MKQTIQRLALGAALTLLLTGASCSLPASTPKVVDGGIYRSTDSGLTWAQKTSIPETGGRIVGFSDATVTALTQDPQDHNVLYLATADKGLLQSMDAGERWTSIGYLGATVTGVAVDYFNKCEFYGMTPAKITRTTNCGRDFHDVLTESRQGYQLVAVITDHYNRGVVYAATTKEILRSNDNGETWATLKRFDDNITSVLMDGVDSRILMVGLKGRGVWRSLDGGKSWIDESEALSKFDGANNVIKIAAWGSASQSYIIATDHGLLTTKDSGTTWTDIPLLTPAKTVKPLVVAADPGNDQKIYYATSTTFYISGDGGRTWKTQKLPTTRLPSTLNIDYKDGRVLYLGTKPLPKQ